MISKCRICGSDNFVPILDLGNTPLANSLLTEDQLETPQMSYPLTLVFCPACTLVQITAAVPPEQLFSQYLYFSSYSDTMLAHAKQIADHLIQSRGLSEQSLVVEIASNDGYLLKNFVAAGIPVLGIEPAKNISSVAQQNSIRTLSEFFDKNLAQKLQKQSFMADVLFANNVLAHVADLHSVVEGIRILLKKNGVAVIETPYVKDMIDNVEFDTIYHEHLCYYSLTALNRLFSIHGLAISDVEHLDIHGGSLRLFVSRPDSAGDRSNVEEWLKREEAWGVSSSAYYENFALSVNRLKKSLLKLLRELRSGGYEIAAYGAAAKGATLLNSFGIGRDLIKYVVDRSPYKQGQYMPGCRLPILAPEMLLERMPDYVLLLTWNFADEILKQQEEYRKRGGKFILFVPKITIV